MKPFASLALLLLAACAAADVRPDLLDLRWRPRPGDVYEVRHSVSQKGEGLDVAVQADFELRIQSVDTDGSASGAMHVKRFVYRSSGSAEERLVFEDGEVKEATGAEEVMGDGGLKEMFERHSVALPLRLLPTGQFRGMQGAGGNHPFLLFSVSPSLGVPLPGRKIEPGETWTGIVRAAHCDLLELSFAVASTGDVVRIRGRTTPKAEAQHRIKVSAEGSYDSREGYVRDARFDIDFFALELEDKIRIVHEIRRKRP